MSHRGAHIFYELTAVHDKLTYYELTAVREALIFYAEVGSKKYSYTIS